MNCVITAGPTYESLDQVRRLTNFSTGRLGAELADFLYSNGHETTLLLGAQATYRSANQLGNVREYGTTEDLRSQLLSFSQHPVDVIFHAAAVSDFRFGKVWLRSETGDLTEVKSGKITTRAGTLMAELLPTTKIIASLREAYPSTRIIGWKYEVEGGRETILALAKRQLNECRTDFCVVNGPAYGAGFGLVSSAGECRHLASKAELFPALEQAARKDSGDV